jgi:serine/threonine protein kinase
MEFLTLGNTVCIETLQTFGTNAIGCICKVQIMKKKYTLKCIDKKNISHADVNDINMEREILGRLKNSTFGMNLISAFQTVNTLYFVLPLYYEADLHEYLRRYYMKPDQAQFIIAELVAGVGELHSLGIIHRDIKTENLMFARDGHLKLIDFDLSFYVGCPLESTAKELVGTTILMAPEMIQNSVDIDDRQPCSFSIDYWAIGLVAFEIIYGSSPFFCGHDYETQTVYDKITKCNVVPLPQNKRYKSLEYVDKFIAGLLTANITERLGFDKIKQAYDITILKNHKFLEEINWQNIVDLKPTRNIKNKYFGVTKKFLIELQTCSIRTYKKQRYNNIHTTNTLQPDNDIFPNFNMLTTNTEVDIVV